MGKVQVSEPRIDPPISVHIVESLYSLRSAGCAAIKAEAFADNLISQTLLSTFMRNFMRKKEDKVRCG